MKIIVKEPFIKTFDYPLCKNKDKWNYEKITIPIEQAQYNSEISYIHGFNISSYKELTNQLNKINHNDFDFLPEIKFALSHLDFQRKKTIKKASQIKKSSLYQLENLEKYKNEKCIKIKIARNNFIQEIDQLKFFLSKNNIKVRLDANQNLNPEALHSYYQALKEFQQNIEYFEEPLAEYSLYKFINKEIPIAHDEFHKEALMNNSENTLVIKPSLFGSIDDLVNLKNKQVVLSHCYESEKIQSLFEYLASFWPNNYHGII